MSGHLHYVHKYFSIKQNPKGVLEGGGRIADPSPPVLAC